MFEVIVVALVSGFVGHIVGYPSYRRLMEAHEKANKQIEEFNANAEA